MARVEAYTNQSHWFVVLENEADEKAARELGLWDEIGGPKTRKEAENYVKMINAAVAKIRATQNSGRSARKKR